MSFFPNWKYGQCFHLFEQLCIHFYEPNNTAPDLQTWLK